MQSWGNLRAGQQTAQQGLTHGCLQIGLVLLCTVIHFVAGQIIEYLADKERGPWLTADRERRIRLSLLDLQTRCVFTCLAVEGVLLSPLIRSGCLHERSWARS